MYILCIQGPLLKGYEPPISSALEAGTFQYLVSRGQTTARTAKRLMETYYYRYTPHSRAITQSLRAPDPTRARGQALFCTWFLEGHCMNTCRNTL